MNGGCTRISLPSAYLMNLTWNLHKSKQIVRSILISYLMSNSPRNHLVPGVILWFIASQLTKVWLCLQVSQSIFACRVFLLLQIWVIIFAILSTLLVILWPPGPGSLRPRSCLGRIWNVYLPVMCRDASSSVSSHLSSWLLLSYIDNTSSKYFCYLFVSLALITCLHSAPALLLNVICGTCLFQWW